MNKQTKRFLMIDYIRGAAVLLMIIFHTAYDLNYFGYLNLDFHKDPLWYWFPRLIVFLFLTAVGLSFPLVHGKFIQWRLFWPRWIKLTLLAIIISISTYFMFPQSWIYFGTLHSIATISLFILPFTSRPRLSLFLGLLILAISLIPNFTWPWPSLPHKSMDYIPALPWVYVSLISIYLNSIGLHRIIKKEIKALAPLKYFGKHSLLIYILHQPLIFGALYFITN